MNQKIWRIESRSSDELYSEDWRARLVTLLGYRPRRVSLFAESLMYGALDCLSRIDETPHFIRINSLNGAQQASLKAAAMCRTELPMPFTFLQSQMSQALVALVAALEWQGDASILMTEHFVDFIHMALLQSEQQSMLLGHADEIFDASNNARNQWLYLKLCTAPDNIKFQTINVWDNSIQYLKISNNQLMGARQV